ncbi:uncharacterized protein TRIADDRAFT_59630 [Trichoplax adhaerens]|uniref:Uncharacterized protein n=2 Tax=Trichoplax adhaerens TaxID=10228 RepID=B3S5I7_TRIAD|nr:predicted protein [Trichoplax adhaerens]EDV21922.1 predicted protein [Trichoplax adhaerens]|eukprot:XP_002115559.1 predicted protein [Trichoplax adhaerens]
MDHKFKSLFWAAVILHILVIQASSFHAAEDCDKSDTDNCTLDWQISEMQQFSDQIRLNGYIVVHFEIPHDISWNDNVTYYWAKSGFANLVPSVTSAEAVIMSGGLLLLFHGTFHINISIPSHSCCHTLPDNCKGQAITRSLLKLADMHDKESYVCSCPVSRRGHQAITGNCRCCKASTDSDQLMCTLIPRIGQHSTTKAYTWLTFILSFASAFHLIRKLILEIHDDLDFRIDPKSKVKKSSLILLTIRQATKIFIQEIKNNIKQLLESHPGIIYLIPFIIVMFSFPAALLQYLCYDLSIQEFDKDFRENYITFIIITVAFVAGYYVLMMLLVGRIKYKTLSFLMASFNSVFSSKRNLNVKKYIEAKEHMLWKFISGQLQLSQKMLDLLAWIPRLILVPLAHLLANFTPFTYILSLRQKFSEVITSTYKNDVLKQAVSKAGHRFIIFLFINLIFLAPFLQFAVRFSLTVGTILASQGSYFLSLLAPFIPFLLILRKEAKKAYKASVLKYNLIKKCYQHLQELLKKDNFYRCLTLQFKQAKSLKQKDLDKFIEIEQSEIDNTIKPYLEKLYSENREKPENLDNSDLVQISKLCIYPFLYIDDQKIEQKNKTESDCKYGLHFIAVISGEEATANSNDKIIKLDSIFDRMETSTQEIITHSLLTKVFAGYGGGIMAITKDSYHDIEKLFGGEYHHLLQFIIQHLHMIAISLIHLLGLYLYHKEAGQNPSLSSTLSVLLTSHTFMQGAKASIQDGKTLLHSDDMCQQIEHEIIKYIFHLAEKVESLSSKKALETTTPTSRNKQCHDDQAANNA